MLNLSLNLVLLLVLFLIGTSNAVKAQWSVKRLPGFSGDLPFTLETGYVSVGEVEFFYYFVESMGNPGADPLLLYLNGGPGCSGLNGFFYQIGPLQFNITGYEGGLPQLLYYPYSWTKTANIIFLDAPVGTGFSYANTAEDYYSSDTLETRRVYKFLQNWLEDHPKFMSNRLFLGSDSYAGVIVPMLAQTILDGNGRGNEPQLHLKGYSIGCPHTDKTIESNTKIAYAHRMALISDQAYETAKKSCNGTYVDVDPSNAACVEALAAIMECIQQVSLQNIIGPSCAFSSAKHNEEVLKRSLKENGANFLTSSSSPRVGDDLWCPSYVYLLSYIWTNYKSVQDALHVRPGKVKEFVRCNSSLDYSMNVDNVVPYHKNLTKTGLRVLAFSGDHDMLVPHIGMEQWIASLDLTVDFEWRPWFVDGQVAGYTRKYRNEWYHLTYATIKGAGHSPTEYKRQECSEMFDRWIHHYPL